jgi:hypothetical protein
MYHMMQIQKEPNYVSDVLSAGRTRANEVATATLTDAKNAVGLYVP